MNKVRPKRANAIKVGDVVVENGREYVIREVRKGRRARSNKLPFELRLISDGYSFDFFSGGEGTFLMVKVEDGQRRK